MKKLEMIGVTLAILGASLASLKFGFIGYPICLLSAATLIFTALKQGNKNLAVMQGYFLAINLVGIYSFC